MYDLFDELKGDHSRLGPAKTCAGVDGAKNSNLNSIVLDQELKEKLLDAESKLDKLDEHFEYLASTAEKSEKLNKAN
jgi:hypothetical protein